MSFSRSLPPRPDLAQQKSQAKELLQSFAAGDPESRARIRAALPDKQPIVLADAQFVLAREYGFTSWAALKQHIESMETAGRSPEDPLHAASRPRRAQAVPRALPRPP